MTTPESNDPRPSCTTQARGRGRGAGVRRTGQAPARRVPARTPALAAALVMLAAGSLSLQAAAPAADAESAPSPEVPSPEVQIARTLLETIPAGSRVALRPLDPRDTGLPSTVGGPLYESVLNAIVRLAGGAVTVLARERLHEVYASLDEFYQGGIEDLLQAAQADIEIICKASPVAEGVTLSCGAVDLIDAVTVAHAAARFALERPVAPLEIAVAEIADRLVEGAPDTGPIDRFLILENATGAQSELGAYLAQHLEGDVARRMTERARREGDEARVAAVLHTATEESAHVPRYFLKGVIWRLDDERIRLVTHLHLGSRSLVAAASDISRSSLPAGLAAGAAAGSSGQIGFGKTYEATAEAVISARLDREAALRAAGNLARARVVAQALDLASPRVTDVRTEADAVAAFEGFLDAGLPVDERFREVRTVGGARDTEERVAVHLVARVVPVGALLRPAVSARLGHTVYQAMEPISIEIRSEEAVHLGVFAWGADNRVVRLYPRGRVRLSARAGETLILPRPGEGRILSAPMPGSNNREDHEAFVVVAASRLLDFAALAPEAGASLSETLDRADDASSFFAALAAQDPARMAVIWLPYQVHH